MGQKLSTAATNGTVSFTTYNIAPLGDVWPLTDNRIYNDNTKTAWWVKDIKSHGNIFRSNCFNPGELTSRGAYLVDDSGNPVQGLTDISNNSNYQLSPADGSGNDTCKYYYASKTDGVCPIINYKRDTINPTVHVVSDSKCNRNGPNVSGGGNWNCSPSTGTYSAGQTVCKYSISDFLNAKNSADIISQFTNYISNSKIISDIYPASDSKANVDALMTAYCSQTSTDCMIDPLTAKPFPTCTYMHDAKANSVCKNWYNNLAQKDKENFARIACTTGTSPESKSDCKCFWKNPLPPEIAQIQQDLSKYGLAGYGDDCCWNPYCKKSAEETLNQFSISQDACTGCPSVDICEAVINFEAENSTIEGNVKFIINQMCGNNGAACSISNPCPSGKTCVSGVCASSTPGPNPPTPGPTTCTTSSDCSDGQTCISGTCVSQTNWGLIGGITVGVLILLLIVAIVYKYKSRNI